jgi:putative hemolysin
MGTAHPGGPFYQGDKYIVLCIRDQFDNTPLKMPGKSRLAGSLENPNPPAEAKPIEATRTTNPNQDEASNPAIARCISLGNIYEDGKCTFPGGTMCDVWEFYRGNCVLAGKRYG